MPRPIGPRKTPPEDFREQQFDDDVWCLNIAFRAPRLLTFEQKFVIWLLTHGHEKAGGMALAMGAHWRDVEDILHDLEGYGLIRREIRQYRGRRGAVGKPGQIWLPVFDELALAKSMPDPTDDMRRSLQHAVRGKFGGAL